MAIRFLMFHHQQFPLGMRMQKEILNQVLALAAIDPACIAMIDVRIFLAYRIGGDHGSTLHRLLPQHPKLRHSFLWNSTSLVARSYAHPPY